MIIFLGIPHGNYVLFVSANISKRSVQFTQLRSIYVIDYSCYTCIFVSAIALHRIPKPQMNQ